MKFMLKIAYTNLLRRFYRSVIIIIMIAIGVMGMMFMNSFFDGILASMKGDFLRTSGHIVVEHKNYKESDLFDDRVSDAKSILQKVSQVDNVLVAASKLVNEGLLATSSTSRFVRVTGVDLDNEKRFGHLDEFLKDGEYNFGKKDKRVIIGAKLAEDLELRVGSKMVVTTQDTNGEIASIGARISGIVKTDNPLIDSLTVFISQEKAEKMFIAADALTTLAVRIKDETKLEETVQAIQKILPEGVRAYSWKEYYPLLVQIDITYETFGTIAYMIVFAIVAIGIFNIILVSVLERLKEYGIMMAVGTPFRKIRMQIILESLIISGIGLFIGLIFGSLLLWYYSEVGITYGDAGKSMSAWGMGTVIYTTWSFEYITAAINAVIVATLISVWMPIRILKKRNPMNVLHFA